MPRKDFTISPNLSRETSAHWDFSLVIRRDFATEEELANAPGVMQVVPLPNGSGHNQTIQNFLISLDPLYETKEEARADFEKWLQDHTVKLDGDVWNTDEPHQD